MVSNTFCRLLQYNTSHIHYSSCCTPLTCVFWGFPIHGCRRGSTLPGILWLAWISLEWGLSWARIGTSRTSGVVRVGWVGLVHVYWVSLWRITLGWVALRRWALPWVAWSRRSTAWVRRRLLEIHLWAEESLFKNKTNKLFRPHLVHITTTKFGVSLGFYVIG